MRQFDDSLPLQLLKAREACMNFFRPLLQENGVTEQQWRILRALHAHGELETKQLANLCCVLSPSLTGIVNRLEQQGYIQRRKSTEDQRRTLLSITDQARQLFDKMSPEVDARYKAFSDKYGEEKLQQLMTLLNDLSKISP